MEALLETALEGLPKRSGKVRDVYDLGDRLLLVATDRISAFDWVLPNGIPDKGRVLTGLSAFWFGRLGVPNHLIGPATDPEAADFLDPASRGRSKGRAVLVRKAEVVPFECVVRGYLEGSGWKEYRAIGHRLRRALPAGLVQGDRIDPIFTPATKAESGHDENVPFDAMVDADRPRDRPTSSGNGASTSTARPPSTPRSKGLILADTKFEWGHDSRPASCS